MSAMPLPRTTVSPPGAAGGRTASGVPHAATCSAIHARYGDRRCPASNASVERHWSAGPNETNASSSNSVPEGSLAANNGPPLSPLHPAVVTPPKQTSSPGVVDRQVVAITPGAVSTELRAGTTADLSTSAKNVRDGSTAPQPRMTIARPSDGSTLSVSIGIGTTLATSLASRTRAMSTPSTLPGTHPG